VCSAGLAVGNTTRRQPHGPQPHGRLDRTVRTDSENDEIRLRRAHLRLARLDDLRECCHAGLYLTTFMSLDYFILFYFLRFFLLFTTLLIVANKHGHSVSCVLQLQLQLFDTTLHNVL